MKGSFGRDHASRHCFRFRLPKNGTPGHLAIGTVVGSVAFIRGEETITTRSLVKSIRRIDAPCVTTIVEAGYHNLTLI